MDDHDKPTADQRKRFAEGARLLLVRVQYMRMAGKRGKAVEALKHANMYRRCMMSWSFARTPISDDMWASL